MKLRDFAIGWRLLLAQPAYSAAVLCGLALGFAASFLLLGFVAYSFSYDSQVPDNAHVFVLKHRVNLIPNAQWTELMPLPARDVVRTSGMVQAVTTVGHRSVLALTGARAQKIDLSLVDPDFASMFAVRVLAGELALERPDAVALTSDTAQRLFGDASAVGKTIALDDKVFTVTAVIAPPPANTTVPYAGLLNADNLLNHGEPHPWTSLFGKVFVRLAPGASAAQLARYLQDAADRGPIAQLVPGGLPGFAHVADFGIGRLSDAYFDQSVARFHGGQRGDKNIVLALAGIAGLILLVAAINYVNLATVRTLRRQREIGVRKALGAGSARLVGQFMAESIVVALIATALGLLLAWLVLPWFSAMVDRDLSGFFNVSTLAGAVLIGALVGLLSGLYPSWVALAVPPAAALAGRGSAETGSVGWLRRALTVAQFAVAIALTGAMLCIAWQVKYASERDPGFDPRGLSILYLPWPADLHRIPALRDALAQLPGVQGVAISEHPIGTMRMLSSSSFWRADGPEVHLNELQTSANFFELYGVQPRFGRRFDARRDPDNGNHAVMLNEAAARALGFPNAYAAIGQHLNRGYYNVIGIAPPLRHASSRSAPLPMVYLAGTSNNPGVLTLRGEVAREQVQAVWQRYFPHDPLEMQSAASVFADAYAEERRVAWMLAMASVTAFGIAVFGIYVLSAYSVQRRVREIALRKLYGANRYAISALLGREFANLVLIASFIGVPLAIVVSDRYLSRFAERAPNGVMAVVLADMAAALAAALATWRNLRWAMDVAPAVVLKD